MIERKRAQKLGGGGGIGKAGRLTWADPGRLTCTGEGGRRGKVLEDIERAKKC